MAEATRYHRLPEDNRPSMDSDSVVDDEERALIGPFDNELASLKQRSKDCKFTWHPTVLTRLIALALLSTGLAFLIVSRQQISIAAIVFVCIALARILLILLHHLFSYFIHVKIVQTSTSTSAQPRNLLSKPAQSRIHVVLDLLIALPLVITASVAIRKNYSVLLTLISLRGYYQLSNSLITYTMLTLYRIAGDGHYWDHKVLQIPGCVLILVAA